MKISNEQMYEALVQRNESFEGIFFVGVKTTGIFCRPTCRARKPKKENVEYFYSVKDAIFRGYRPCKVCDPMSPKGEFPDGIKNIMEEIMQSSTLRFNDFEFRKRGIDPNRFRRWFKKNHNMTFQTYLRSLRLGKAFCQLTGGKKVIDTALAHGYESLSGFNAAFKKNIGVNPTESVTKNLIHVHRLFTPLGPMLAATVTKGLCLLEFIDRRMLESELKDLKRKFRASLVTSLGLHMRDLQIHLEEYFQGKRKKFEIPLVTPGSEFQQKVWKVLRDIPYGQTRSYRDQAIAVGNPKALRAVARANGANKIAIIIPCHRVIGSGGQLVGYGGGVWRKKFLLDLEQKNAIVS